MDITGKCIKNKLYDGVCGSSRPLDTNPRHAGQCNHRPLSYWKPYKIAMEKSIYQWLFCSFLFILVDGSPSYPIKSIIATSHSDILSSEVRTQQDTCGSTGNSDGCTPGENCTYECSLLHEPPPEYNNSCQFIEENCGDEYELLNYLQFIDCHLGPNLQVCILLYVHDIVLLGHSVKYTNIVFEFLASRIHNVGAVVALSLVSSIYNGLYMIQLRVLYLYVVNNYNRLTIFLFLCCTCSPINFVYLPALQA